MTKRKDTKGKKVSTALRKGTSEAKLQARKRGATSVAIQPKEHTDKPKITTKPKALPKKMGRPSIYSAELADLILNQIADGIPLNKICEPDHMPVRGTVRRWTIAHADFRTMYAQAREEFAHALVDELLLLADQSREGSKTKTSADGIEVTTGDMVERTRLQIDTRKWLASKILPKKYGDKLEVDQTGEVKHTIKFTRG